LYNCLEKSLKNVTTESSGPCPEDFESIVKSMFS
jgi:hypothetical protein